MIDTSNGPKLTREERMWLIAVYEASEGTGSLDPMSLFDEEASHRWTQRGFREQFERVVRAHNAHELTNSPLPASITINRFAHPNTRGETTKRPASYACYSEGRAAHIEPLRAEAMRNQLETK